MIKKITSYLIFIIISQALLEAQEVVTGLPSSYLLKKNSDLTFSIKSKSVQASLQVPFFDDFSGKSIYPDKNKWSDDFVLINNTYTEDQVTKGVATFDALDNFGKLYADASSSGFPADNLTSLPLNLNYTASDNVFFSFYYQAGGLSDVPEANDSLTLQFFAPTENKWYSVWQSDGINPVKFKPVILKIDNSRYLLDGFRFRFINYASLSPNLSDPSMVGNCDIWNIDYIVLDKNRTQADTVFADVALRLPLRSLLKSHESMPWKQFKKVYLQEMGSAISITYRNNDLIARNITRDFEIWDVYKNLKVHSFSSGAVNVDPLTNVLFNANLIYRFDSDNPDSALFKIISELKTDLFDPKGNDTLVYYQAFKNYFAFDDGTSEGGYGLNGLGSRNAMFAHRFKSYFQDTLRAIQICFNDSYLDANQRSFNLMVWNDNNGIPGDAIYSVEDLMVEPANNANGFFTYKFPEGVVVNGTFYVGWKQISETFINAGYDANTPHKSSQFYWLNGEWRNSQVNGTVMIRPMLGDPLRTTSVRDIYSDSKNLFKLWPNPASDNLNIRSEKIQLSDAYSVNITDFGGKIILSVPYSETIDISMLHKGVYFVSIKLKNISVGHLRLIKT